MCLRPDVDTTSQECAGSDHDATGAEAPSLQGFNAQDTSLIRVEDESSNGTLHGLQIWVLFEEGPYRTSVEPAVALRARSPDSRTLASIEHAELNHGEIGSSSHDSAECIDLADDGSFGDASNRRIARHLPDGFEGARNQADTSSKTGSGNSCFGAGMTGANYQDVEFGFKVPR